MSYAELTLVSFAEPRGIARKTCRACGEAKLLTEMTRVKGLTNGLCLVCGRARQRTRMAKPENRAKKYAQDRTRYYENNDEIRSRENERRRIRWAADPSYRARELLRDSTRRAQKRETAVEDIGVAALTSYWADDLGLTGCYVCGAPYEHIDHFIPLADGGTHTLENLVPACEFHNTSKGAKQPGEYLAYLSQTDAKFAPLRSHMESLGY